MVLPRGDPSFFRDMRLPSFVWGSDEALRESDLRFFLMAGLMPQPVHSSS